MRWSTGRRSTNVRDRRGMGVVAGGGVGVVILAIVAMLFGVDPGDILPGGGEVAPGTTTAADDTLADFVTVVLADTEDVWNDIFASAGGDYAEPTLELFSGITQSGCGMAQAAVGPFYCPLDGTIYIDLSFYRDLRDRFGAPGDFAQAYVIAHEVGHHVQNLLGIAERVEEARRSGSADANALSVRLELQADCLAGVWAHRADRARNVIEPGDIEEALNAAAAIGDDRLQRRSGGTVVPESFTHGTSEQRARWFRAGLAGGGVAACETFGPGQV